MQSRVKEGMSLVFAGSSHWSASSGAQQLRGLERTLSNITHPAFHNQKQGVQPGMVALRRSIEKVYHVPSGMGTQTH